MQDKLQRHYQIQKEVSRCSFFKGILEPKLLERLRGKLENDQDNILVEFEFGDSDYGHPVLKGNLETSLSMECQRCLKGMKLPIKIAFDLLIDAPDEMAVESSLDTIYSTDGSIDIYQVVEEELILGLPLVVMHEDTSCNEFWGRRDNLPDASLKENPFSVLKKLKTNE